jgi:IclR family mhp operon transcriptional activator
MEVIETNSPRSYFHHIPLGPIGFRVNMLRSASGRAYLAHVEVAERDALLERLCASSAPGDAAAHDRRSVLRVLAETRRRGYAVREPSFGGHYDKMRREWDDGRDSIAVPIIVGESNDGGSARVVGCVNLTWIRRVTTVAKIVARHLPALRAAAGEIAVAVGGTPKRAR